MDLVWLVIPAAAAIFALRTLVIARRLKAASKIPALVDTRALSDAKKGLHEHRGALEAAIAAPKRHLAAAKNLPRAAVAQGRRAKGVDAMVEDFLPERRL